MRTNTTEQSLPANSWFEWRYLICAVLAFLIGVSGPICIKMTSRGFVSGIFSSIPFVAYPLMLVWPSIAFLAGLLFRKTGMRLTSTIVRALFFSFITSLIAFFGCALASTSFPDPARIYLWLWRPYVESHWQVDPVTHLTYFPLDYTGVGKENKEIVPHNFFILDDKEKFVLDASSYHGISRLIAPFCPNAKYEASRLDEKIYIVANYVDDPDEPSEPCLITPAPMRGISHD
jgi:hypothetical protein